jgi:hypothetical protein
MAQLPIGSGWVLGRSRKGSRDSSSSLRRKPEPRDAPRLIPKRSWLPACAGMTELGPRADFCTKSS